MVSDTLIAIFRNLIIPPISLLILFTIGYLYQRRYPRAGSIVSIGALLFLLAISTRAGAWLLLDPLENLEPVLVDTRSSAAQAIVVLSAGSIENSPEYDHHESPDYVALARIRYAAKLYRDTGLPILVSGGFGSQIPPVDSLASAMARVLNYEFAIPVRWQEDQSKNTRENALYSAWILKQEGITHILLVTDAMHMHRARLAFEQTGLLVTPAPTVFFSHASLSILSYLPSAEGLRRSQYAVYEWLGLFRHYISSLFV
jgi:uncharacterized SAM-binding protein YcdF (DUF218 family)